MSEPKTLDGQTAKLLAALVESLPRGLRAARAQYFIENPHELRRVLVSGLLEKMELWRAYPLGRFIGVDLADVLEEIDSHSRSSVSSLAKSIINGEDYRAQNRHVRQGFALVSPSDLGLPNAVEHATVVEHARWLGLSPCLPGDALEIVNMYAEGGPIPVRMRPIHLGTAETLRDRRDRPCLLTISEDLFHLNVIAVGGTIETRFHSSTDMLFRIN